MRTEIPVYKRCCFCLPLRYGLIVWGYLRLCISTALLIFFGLLWHAIFTGGHFFPRDLVYIGIATFIMISDFILSLVFIVGCHKKNVKHMKVFYFYSQFLLGFSTAWTIYLIVLLITDFVKAIEYSSEEHRQSVALYFGNYIATESIAFFGHLFLQLYILLLVRSEIVKLNNGCQFRFVNHADEAQCTLDVTTLPTQRLHNDDDDKEAC